MEPSVRCLLALQVPDRVIFVPAGMHYHYRAARLEARVKCRIKPLMHILLDRRALRLLPVFMGVIDYSEVAIMDKYPVCKEVICSLNFDVIDVVFFRAISCNALNGVINE